jgi:ectoine hydroxylase-related dioxygenase (phytanoyl-CoA dioxygenase family)
VVFFNPALLHASGSNHSTDIRRMANLMQISSAFGRAMETIDRERVCTAVIRPSGRRRARPVTGPCGQRGRGDGRGYPFATNLDRAQPIDGLAPPSRAELLAQAVVSGSALEELANTLAAQRETQLSQ